MERIESRTLQQEPIIGAFPTLCKISRTSLCTPTSTPTAFKDVVMLIVHVVLSADVAVR
jgi:hypothetical protein